MSKNIDKETPVITIFNGKKYPAKHLHENAFARGRKEFMEGKRIPMTFSKVQQIDAEKLEQAINRGKVNLAEKLADKLLSQHIILCYHIDAENKVTTISGMYTTVADNPYPSGSFAYKEWQRGFNQAYARNLKKVNYERTRSDGAARHSRSRPKYRGSTTVNA